MAEVAVSGGVTLSDALVMSDAETDSIRHIREVTVSSPIRHHETIEPQTLQGAQLEQVNAHTVADALRYMGGVQLKDYGGLGGLKTVNLRSLGSQHVGIYYDGIELGNAQNGVIDLGQFSLDNVEAVSLYHGQRSAILQTASDFVNAGSIYIRTRHNTQLTPQAPQHWRLRAQYGATNMLRLSALYERRLGSRWAMNANVEGLNSDGHYDFRYRRLNYDGSVAYDTTATRQNGDVLSLRAEVNLYGRTWGNGIAEAKVYTYHSTRGIPGAIVNNVWRRGERQSDDNTFAQCLWQADVAPRLTLRALAKYAAYRTHYLNRDSTQLLTDVTYRQHEAYTSLTAVTELTPWWSLSLSYDARYNRLSADQPLFAYPTRWTHLCALATAMDLGPVQLQGSVVGAWVDDQVERGTSAQATRCCTPALFVSYRPVAWLQLSGFAKRSFRMPTFNDLYYTQVGNALLQPEVAVQYDMGLRLQRGTDATPLALTWTTNLYHNTVHDKIVAFPGGQQFRWTMLNLGHVSIWGIDVQAQARWRIMADLECSLLAQYTWQQARDETDPTSACYGHQIPYTPWHSGSVTASVVWRGWDVAYNCIYTGERYSQPENIAYNHLQPWYTSDLHLAYSWRRCRFTLEANNIFDQQYDVVINYPMPGRTFNFTMQCEI